MRRGQSIRIMAATVLVLAVLGWGAAAQGAVGMRQVGPVVPFYATPTDMDLCGSRVPLDRTEVWERFDREFTIVVYSHAQVYLWLKRLERFSPWIDQQLKEYGLPEDLKFLAVAESDLQVTAKSPANAAGIWQFIPSTGSRYGMRNAPGVDERYDFEKATLGALQYLGDLHRMFGDWALAMAAYNCGERRVRQELAAQNVSDYYSLKLPLETERYVFRILAIKAVLSDPYRYGYFLPEGAGYPQIEMDRAQVNFPRSVPIQRVAEACTMTLRAFKVHNPIFVDAEVPAGFHTLRVPKGAGATAMRNLEQLAAESPPPEAAPASCAPAKPAAKTVAKASAKAAPTAPGKAAAKAPEKAAKPKYLVHKVAKGDTLSSIARRYQVSVADVQRWNDLKSTIVQPGQSLKIENP